MAHDKKNHLNISALGCITTRLIGIHSNIHLQEGMVIKGKWCIHLHSHAPKHLHGAM
jgi:hypothetical protein